MKFVLLSTAHLIQLNLSKKPQQGWTCGFDNESKWRAGYNITNDWALFSLINPLGRRRSIKLAPLDQYTIKLLLGSKFQNL